MLSSKCYGHVACISHVSLNSNISRVLIAFSNRVLYSKDKGKGGTCCENIPQTAGKKVEPWPKPDPPPPLWRAECPQDPQPVNNDPYRIKVPDVVVPPLPPSNAKWSGVVLTTDQHGLEQQGDQQQQQQPFCQQQPYGQNYEEEEEEEQPKSFMGMLKGFLGKIRGKGKEGDSMPMLDCAKTKGQCTPKLVPPPPPCPPPPPKPFPWNYVCALMAFFGAFGMMYRLYVWREETNRTAEKPIWRPRRKIKRPYHDKDLPACVQYLIIGAGAAGWSAYRSIMQHDKTAKVFFVTKEDCLPYQRPPMANYMWWNADPPDIKTLNYVDDEHRRHTMYDGECKNFMDPVKFYRRKIGPAVSIATGWCVLRVDADDHVAYVKTMCGEQPIYYERCLLAPGSKAKNLEMFKTAPKAVRDRVTVMRTIRDLENAYRKVKESKNVVIIGGGPLGTELAYHLGRMNKLVERDDDSPPIEFVHLYKDKGVLAGLVPQYLGEWAAEKIRCQGVTLMPQTQVYDAYTSADGRLELTLSNGKTIVTDFAFVAVGATPRTEMAKPSFLETDPENDGFLVNTELKARTHLYVAGDAASFYSQWKDQRQRFEHYAAAEEQGFVAGANMTGYWTPCNMEQHFRVKLSDDLFMEVVGDVGACMPTVGLFKECEVDSIYFPANADEKTKKNRVCFKQGGEYEARYKHGILFYLRDETVVGFVFWNMKPPIEDRWQVATELLRARPSYKDIDVLADLLGFSTTTCIYKSTVAEVPDTTCITNRKEF